MKARKGIATVFVLVAVILGAIFFAKIDFPQGLDRYFEKAYYSQFGPIVLSVELLIAGVHLFTKHDKANFTLALFGFTAVLDTVFSLVGLFPSGLPLYATILFVGCGLVALWLAFTNAFGLGRISLVGVITSFLLGNGVEMFFGGL